MPYSSTVAIVGADPLAVVISPNGGREGLGRCENQITICVVLDVGDGTLVTLEENRPLKKIRETRKQYLEARDESHHSDQR